MIQTVLRLVFLLALAVLPTGCNIWPWGGTTDFLPAGNLPSGQQASVPGGGSAIPQSDFRHGASSFGW